MGFVRVALAAGLALCVLGTVHARQAGEPRSWSMESKSAIPLIELEAVDAAALLAEDDARVGFAKGGGALRFAVPRAAALTPSTGGRWLAIEGGRLWQARVRVPHATDLNLAFSRFTLPVGATLHVFSTRERYYEGPYMSGDATPQGGFWSPVVPGEEAVVELYVPQGRTADLALAAVNGGYRDLFGRAGGPLMKQGSCNVDVACPLGDAYRNEIRSVARYSINGLGFCTGTLMMDAAGSFRPWFLTAAHCGLDNDADAASVVVYWNFESATCGDLDGGSLADNQAGASFRAIRADVDMSLVELDALPDPGFGVYYSGWDRSNAAPVGSIHIHHPNGDEKAISLNDDVLTTGNSCINSGGVSSHWIIDDYEQGTTEPGSSGSGVWTLAPNPRLIGFLSGGGASCANLDLGDCYGKFPVAWDGAGSTSRLRDWLGGGLVSPPLAVDGSEPAVFAVSVASDELALCRADSAAVEVTVASTGGFTDPVALSVSGAPAGVGAVFADSPVVPPAATQLTVNVGAAVVPGDYVLQVEGDASTQQDTAPLALRVDAIAPASPSPLSPAAGAGAVDRFPVLSWSAVAGASGYRLQLAVGGDFGNPLVDVIVEEARHAITTALEPGLAYQWRVAARNGCGVGAFSAARSFSTGTALCLADALAIPDGNLVGASQSVTIADARNIGDLDLAVEIDHTWVGDVSVMLRHEDSAVEMIAIDRPGVPASGFGCSNNDIDATLDDEAFTPVEGQCAGGVAIAGNFRPNQSLTAFDALALAGTWTLRVSDAAGDDTGTLLRWCLQPTLVAGSGLIFANGFE